MQPLPSSLPYLQGYPAPLIAQAQQLIDEQRLAEHLAQRYPDKHDVRSDKALFDYLQAIKGQFMRSSEPVNKVQYDNKLKVIQHALGTHTRVSRVQGTQLKAKREIRVASLFKETPTAFLRMIVVHELAHLRHSDHDKAFYALCTHMESSYHQLEFDLRLNMTLQSLTASQASATPD